MAEEIPVTLPSKELIQETQAMVRAWKSGEFTTSGPYSTGVGEANNSPDTYLAYPNFAEQLPARTDEESSFIDETLGEAECDIYTIRGDGELFLLEHRKKVYNVSVYDIEETCIVVTKLKSGAYVHTCPFQTLVVSTEPDYIVGIQGSTLVKVAVGDCAEE